MSKKSAALARSLEVEVNNGGSFVRLALSDIDGLVILNVGHECVRRVVDTHVAVTELAELLADRFGT